MDHGIDKETDGFAAYIDCLPQTSRVFSNQEETEDASVCTT